MHEKYGAFFLLGQVIYQAMAGESTKLPHIVNTGTPGIV
jgi:hypothetical protein